MPQDFIFYLLSVPAALIALSVHECCHGYAAYRLGDPTARSLGRLTLNPLAHLDPVGTVFMVLFRFGWARPVPVNSRYFKDPRKGMAITAAAGPLSNLFMALLGAIFYLLTLQLGIFTVTQGIDGLPVTFISYLALFFNIFHFLNLSLFVFNLIPLPPLDGSRIFYVFLPPRMYFGVMRHERTIQIVLLIALWLGAFTGVISRIVTFLSDSIFDLLLLIPFFA